jgi:hypothetical protein
MGALYRVATVVRPRPSPRLLRATATATLAAWAAACGGRRVPPEEAKAPELLVEVLPPDAAVSLDGRPLGRGSRAVPAPPPGDGPRVLRVEADGYEPAERPLEDGSLAGVRVAAVLRPLGFASFRILDYDDPEGLALAAAHLALVGERPRDALAYAERALALEPGTALAHRAAGDARAALGEAGRAVSSWTEYLRLAPEAPDAARVAERIEDARAEPAPAR